MSSYLQAVRLIPRDAWKVMLVSVVVGIGYFGIHTVLFNLYLLRMGYGPEFIGLFNGTAMLASAACSIPAGMAGRRWGLRRAMLAGYVIWTMMSILLPQAQLVPAAWRTAWLLTTFAVTWIAVPFWVVNSATYLVGITGEQERQHTFAVSRALNRLAAMAGSLLAGFLPVLLAAQRDLSLDSPTVYRYTLYVAPILYVSIMPVLWTLRPVYAARERAGQGDSAPPYGLFVAMAVFIILAGTAEAAGETYFNVYMDESLQVSPALIGVLVAAAQLMAVPATLAAPLIVARWGSLRTILGLGLGQGISMLVLAFASIWVMAGLGFAGIMVLASIMFPVRTIFHQESVDPEWRSTMSGIVSLAMQIGRAAMVVAGGFLIVRLGYSGMFTVAGLLTFAGALFFWVYFRRLGSEPTTEAASV